MTGPCAQCANPGSFRCHDCDSQSVAEGAWIPPHQRPSNELERGRYEFFEATREREQKAIDLGDDPRFAPTDQEAFKAMLSGAGIEFDEKGSIITIGTGDGSQNDGYCGFYAEFIFDEDNGKLLRTGVWE